MNTPTLNAICKTYIEAASVEQLRCGKPSNGTIRNTLCGVKKFREWTQGIGRPIINDSSAYTTNGEPLTSIITPKIIRKYLAFLLSSNMKPVSAISFVNQLQSLFAKWVKPYYEDQGWQLPSFPSIANRRQSPRYIRPAPEQITAVKKWYNALPLNMVWFTATMMLEFAMRNGDISRLKRNNFVESNGKIYLNYIPNKTKNSSGRFVKWPIHPDIWNALQLLKPWNKCVTESLFSKVNSSMRALGFTGSKGAYELRKICIDHVYQKYGAEMATSISGDDIKTIIRYYADPTQPNLDTIRITSLL